MNAGGTATHVTLKQGGALVTSTAATVLGSNRLGNFTVENGKADGVVLESGGRLDVLEGHSAQKTRVDDGGTLAVSAGGKATDVTMTSGGALIADSGATVEGTNASGKFSIDGISGQASGLLLENGGSFTVNAGGQASNTTVGHRGTLMLAAGGSLSGRTQLSKGASMVLNGDVVSTGDIVNAGEIYFDNQTTPDAVLSRAVAKGNAPVTFHKLTTSNLTGQGGTINMRVRLDGSNASDQLVINGGQATGKTWLAFTNVGNSNLGVATTGQGIRVLDAQNGATTEEGAFTGIRCSTAHITETDNAWLYSLSHQTSDFGESEWIHFTGTGYLLRTDAWSYPVLRLKRLGLSKTFRRLVVTLIRRYGVSLIHLDASAGYLPGLPTFDW